MWLFIFLNKSMKSILSQKLKIASFLLMIMVVFLHSYNLDIKQNKPILFFEKDLNWIIQNFISFGLTRIAVPLFFIISGYLFVYDKKTDLPAFVVKLKKRISTLLIPYLFWTLIGLLFYFILQSIPQIEPFFTKKLIRNYNWRELLSAIINEPIPYQLWFLKDLIVMVFISPLLVFLVKKLNFFFLLVIFLFWFLNQDSIILTSEALLFFSIGIYLSVFKPDLIEFKTGKASFFLFLWIVLLILKTFFALVIGVGFLDVILLKVSILVGIIAFWFNLDNYIKKIVNYKIFISGIEFSFFLYLFHEPLLTIIKKALFAVLSQNTYNSLIVYFIAPIITILLSIFVGRILKSKLKRIYLFSTGGR